MLSKTADSLVSYSADGHIWKFVSYLKQWTDSRIVTGLDKFNWFFIKKKNYLQCISVWKTDITLSFSFWNSNKTKKKVT